MRTRWGTVALLCGVWATACTSSQSEDTDDTMPPIIDSDNDGFPAEEDCNDEDASIYPGATEQVNDGIDQDCDGLERCPSDADGDGYGAADGATDTSSSLDCIGDGVATNTEDCNDASTQFYPGAPEDDCTDPNDYNCDGSTGFADADGDGWAACEDCNDVDDAQNPDATELPGDEIDQDCDGKEICFLDGDDDGYRPDATTTVNSSDTDCQDTTEATSDEPTDDCDDSDANAYPGATEIWYDGVDQDCGSDSDYDQDGDGHDSDAHRGEDCDDLNSSVHPTATEIRQNGVDEDCDGEDAPYIVTDLSAGDLVLTEVMRAPKSVTDDKGEWFEFINASGGTLNLSGLYVYDTGGDAFTVSSALIVNDGDYVVFGNNASTTSNGGVAVDYAYPSASFALDQGDDSISFAESSSKTTVIDTLDWDDDYFPDTQGYAANLDNAYDTTRENDHEGNWCDAESTFGSGDRGTPGAANDDCGFTYIWSDVSSIFASKCGSCHTSGSSGGLSGITNWSNVTWVRSSQDSSYYLIDPFSPDDSYIWQKIEGSASSGGVMPRGGSLTRSQTETIETWIDEGAPQ